VLLGLASLPFASGRVTRVSLARGVQLAATSAILAILMALGLYFSGAGRHPTPERPKIGLGHRSGHSPVVLLP
jgi:hypothetical protein